MIEGLQIRAINRRFRGGVIDLFGEIFGNTLAQCKRVKPVTLESIESDDLYKTDIDSHTMCSISIEAAQQLMDDLWQAGLRPSEGTGSAGALAATQRHLDDMRKMMFHQFNIKDWVK